MTTPLLCNQVSTQTVVIHASGFAAEGEGSLAHVIVRLYERGFRNFLLDTAYPGGNLFSLASGGAIYIRDPHGKVSEEQLNGGEFARLEEHVWAVLSPCLEENERLFGIPVARLLEVDGNPLPPAQVYRKIRPRVIAALQAEEAWVKMHV